jgi:hypothetical protein
MVIVRVSCSVRLVVRWKCYLRLRWTWTTSRHDGVATCHTDSYTKCGTDLFSAPCDNTILGLYLSNLKCFHWSRQFHVRTTVAAGWDPVHTTQINSTWLLVVISHLGQGLPTITVSIEYAVTDFDPLACFWHSGNHEIIISKSFICVDPTEYVIYAD